MLTKEDLLSIQVLIQQSLVANNKALIEDIDRRMDAKFQDFELKMDSKIDQKISDALQTFFRRDLMPFLNIMATKDDIDKIDRRLTAVENKLVYLEKQHELYILELKELRLRIEKLEHPNYSRSRFNNR